MRTCRLMDFAIPADYRGEIKENESINKYLDLAGELKGYGIAIDVLGAFT